MADLTKKRAEQLFYYDKENGILFWRTRPVSDFASEGAQQRWNKLFAGMQAGCLNSYGYITISIKDLNYLAHRVIWTIETGMPPAEIDHADGDRSNNKFENLRQVSRAENSKNRAVRDDSKSRITGVIWSRRDNCWYARINIDGKQTHLGTFHRIEDAIAARHKAERDHGYHPNHASHHRPIYRREI